MKDLVDYMNDKSRPLSGGTGNRDIMEKYDMDDDFYDMMLHREYIDEEDEYIDDEESELDIVEDWINNRDI